MAMPLVSASEGPAGLIVFAVKAHGAFVRHMHAEDQIAQRRLAGAVLAENAMNLARHDVERGVRQRHQGAEPLGDALQRQERFGQASRWVSHCNRSSENGDQ